MYLVNTIVNKTNTAAPVPVNIIGGKGRYSINYVFVIKCDKK